MKWISIKDRLPESYEINEDTQESDVVITNAGAGGLVNGKWVVADTDCGEAGKRLDGVTHWMNMPEFKEGGE